MQDEASHANIKKLHVTDPDHKMGQIVDFLTTPLFIKAIAFAMPGPVDGSGFKYKNDLDEESDKSSNSCHAEGGLETACRRSSDRGWGGGRRWCSYVLWGADSASRVRNRAGDRLDGGRSNGYGGVDDRWHAGADGDGGEGDRGGDTSWG